MCRIPEGLSLNLVRRAFVLLQLLVQVKLSLCLLLWSLPAKATAPPLELGRHFVCNASVALLFLSSHLYKVLRVQDVIPKISLQAPSTIWSCSLTETLKYNTWIFVYSSISYGLYCWFFEGCSGGWSQFNLTLGESGGLLPGQICSVSQRQTTTSHPVNITFLVFGLWEENLKETQAGKKRTCKLHTRQVLMQNVPLIITYYLSWAF